MFAKYKNIRMEMMKDAKTPISRLDEIVDIHAEIDGSAKM